MTDSPITRPTRTAVGHLPEHSKGAWGVVHSLLAAGYQAPALAVCGEGLWMVRDFDRGSWSRGALDAYCRNNSISEKGAAALAAVLPKLVNLKTLNLE